VRACDSFKRDRDIVLAAVQNHGFALQFACDSFKRDRDIVMGAVKQKGRVLGLADDSLKRDRGIVLAAARKDGLALQFAGDSLKRDWDVVLAAVRQNEQAAQDADEALWCDQPDMVQDALRVNGHVLKYLVDSLWERRDIVLDAVKQNGNDLRHAHERFKRSSGVARVAVRQTWRALGFVDEALWNDEEILTLAIEQWPERAASERRQPLTAWCEFRTFNGETKHLKEAWDKTVDELRSSIRSLKGIVDDGSTALMRDLDVPYPRKVCAHLRKHCQEGRRRPPVPTLVKGL
jgi:hypothetical protein